MPSKKRRGETSNEPSLEHDFQISPVEDDTVVFRSTIRRGELSVEFIQWSDGRPLACNSDSAKIRLRLLAAAMRARLDRAGYPTDRDHVWIREGDEDWRPDSDRGRSTEDRPYELRSWHDQLVATTEPLSKARIQGDVLHFIDQILRYDLSEDILRPVLELALAFGQLRISGRINRLAMDGAARKRALLQGGRARARSGASKLELVCKHAENCWRQKAAMRGNRDSTAELIKPVLNEEIRAIGEKPLGRKRIADLISKGISGGLLQIG